MISLIIVVTYLLGLGMAMGYLFSLPNYEENDSSFLAGMSLIWPITLILVIGLSVGVFISNLFTRKKNVK